MNSNNPERKRRPGRFQRVGRRSFKLGIIVVLGGGGANRDGCDVDVGLQPGQNRREAERVSSSPTWLQ